MNTKRVQAAEGVILAALKTRQLAVGIAIALESACLLQSPETAAEMAGLRARVRELEAERHSTNEALSDAAVQLRVQRDRIAELEAAAVCSSVARLFGSKCVLPVRHRGDHQDETKRHFWSDDYALGRDLPEVPGA